MKKLIITLIIALISIPLSAAVGSASMRELNREEMMAANLPGFQYYYYMESHKGDVVPTERRSKDDEWQKNFTNEQLLASMQPRDYGQNYTRQIKVEASAGFHAGNATLHVFGNNTVHLEERIYHHSAGTTIYGPHTVTVISGRVITQAH